jgi:hypothetical protein
VPFASPEALGGGGVLGGGVFAAMCAGEALI